MTRVFVGMSGGVDSSVAAALLVEQGYQVTGVYMKNWTEDLPGMRCPWAEDLADAKRVAVALGIDFLVFDFERDYRDRVVRYMIETYRQGRTPNPDIMCNQEVKFRLFLDTARDQGADMIATGHYARVDRAGSAAEGRLLMAADANKDQTYFLYRVTAAALGRTLFPLGDYQKPEVRRLAQERGLVTAEKPESMGVCFVGQVGIRDFLGRYLTTQPGDIIDHDSGVVIGQHDGAALYTLGQRHGLRVGGSLPYYVVGKDIDRNQVYVSRNLNHQAIWRRQLFISDQHWIGAPPAPNEPIQVRLRHRGALRPGRYQDGLISLEEPERAVAPGQSAVIYRGQECLGGGIVSEQPPHSA